MLTITNNIVVYLWQLTDMNNVHNKQFLMTCSIPGLWFH